MESSVLDTWPLPQEPLPRGPHGLPRDVVERSQRSRLLLALIEVVADKGYVATTVADVIRRAGVSRTTFYQQFKDKEDCFLVAYRKGADAQFRKVTEVVESATDPLEQLRRNVRAYLGSWSPTRRPRGPSCWRSRPPGPGRSRSATRCSFATSSCSSASTGASASTSMACPSCRSRSSARP